METLDEVLARILKANPKLVEGSAEFKTLVVSEAAKVVGYSDTKIAKFTGYSRGFVIPRVKRLKVELEHKEITRGFLKGAPFLDEAPQAKPDTRMPRPQKAAPVEISEEGVEHIGSVRFF